MLSAKVSRARSRKACARSACAGRATAGYRGLAKTGLQNVAAAAALNLDRLAAWFTKRPLAPTRVSRFAALAA